jgi:hypothetical protein
MNAIRIAMTTSEPDSYWMTRVGYLENIITKERFELKRIFKRYGAYLKDSWFNSLNADPDGRQYFELKLPIVHDRFVEALDRNRKAIFKLVLGKDNTTIGAMEIENEILVKLIKIRLSYSRYNRRYGLKKVTSIIAKTVDSFEVFKKSDKYIKKYGTQTSQHTKDTIA